MAQRGRIWLTVLVTFTSGNPALWAETHAQYKAQRLSLEGAIERPEGAPAKLNVAPSPPRRIRWVRMTGLPAGDKQTLWSSWGDGCWASNGKYYTSIGDHRGNDATSYIYEFSPVDGKLRRVADLFSALRLKPGDYGHGKVHGGLHEHDGWIYFSTYWGKHRQVEEAYTRGFRGSVLMRLHLDNHRVESLGNPVPRQGLPTSLLDPQRGLLYFYAVYDNNLVAYDVRQRRRVFLGGQDRIAGNRAMMLDAGGGVYTSGNNGKLLRYDPQDNALAETKFDLGQLGLGSGDQAPVLRAGLPSPLPDGKLVGMTRGGRIFMLDPSRQSLVDLGDNVPQAAQYTAVMKASPDGKYLYYAPGAHGSGAKLGAPIIRFDIPKRRATAIVFLAPLLRRHGYQIGGSYNLVVAKDGRRLYATFNGAPKVEPLPTQKGRASKQPLFGEPCMLEIDLQ